MGNLPFNPITFPLWWYTVGFLSLLRWTKSRFWSALRKGEFPILLHELFGYHFVYRSLPKRTLIIALGLTLIAARLIPFALRLSGLFLALVGYLLIVPLTFIFIFYQLLALL